ncbi:MAG: virulence-associated E family protein [Clostridiales bacterium]|jgi:hypothetical protein|nr:virulence-associated E family protein [Clostridiales bacterium]
MQTLDGPQSAGKSLFLQRIAVDPNWFTATLTLADMKDKTLPEKIQGSWICPSCRSLKCRMAQNSPFGDALYMSASLLGSVNTCVEIGLEILSFMQATVDAKGKAKDTRSKKSRAACR